MLAAPMKAGFLMDKICLPETSRTKCFLVASGRKNRISIHVGFLFKNEKMYSKKYLAKLSLGMID